MTAVLRFILLAGLLGHSPAFGEGYLGWSFGMSKAEVATVGDSSRYYSFSNGDLGAQNEPFEGSGVPISFYFENGKLNRVMLMPYMGSHLAKAREAWVLAYAHIKRKCTGVEVSEVGSDPVQLEAALAIFDVEAPKLQQGQRHQMGCLPMPSSLRLWASVRRLANDSLMVSVNYGEP
jgi:hypothetical protein